MFVLIPQCGTESQAAGHEDQSEGEISGARGSGEQTEGGDGADHGSVRGGIGSALSPCLRQ